MARPRKTVALETASMQTNFDSSVEATEQKPKRKYTRKADKEAAEALERESEQQETEKVTETSVASGLVNGGNWNSPSPTEIPMHYMHVEVMWTQNALGTSPKDTSIFEKYIAERSGNPELIAEEVEAIRETIQNEIIVEDESGQKEKVQLNIYPKGTFYLDEERNGFIDHKSVHGTPPLENFKRMDGIPFLFDYQIRGFFKDSCGLMSRAEEIDEKGKKKGTTESGKLKAYKKIIDGCIFVWPRRIAINLAPFFLEDDGVTETPVRDENGNLRIMIRPIHISGPQGNREALAASEMIPAGSTMKFTIGMTSLKYKPAIIEWLNYATVHGISGWRNSGMGTCIWREIPESQMPEFKD